MLICSSYTSKTFSVYSVQEEIAMDDPQACERQDGSIFCPLHPDKEITSCCKKCQILVCPDCMNSKNHDGHPTRYVTDSDILKPPCDKLAKRMRTIQKVLLGVEKELILTEKETAEVAVNRNNGIQSLTLEGELLKNNIDIFTNMQKVAYNAHYDQTEMNLKNHKEDVTQMKYQLTNERERISDILKSGSAILKFDVGTPIDNDFTETIPNYPGVQEITNVLFQFVDKLKYPESRMEHSYTGISISNIIKKVSSIVKGEPKQNSVPEDYVAKQRNTDIAKVSEDAVNMPTQQNTAITKVSEDTATMPTQQTTAITKVSEDAATMPTQQNTDIISVSEDAVTMPTQQNTVITKISEDAVTMPTQQNTVITKVSEDAAIMPTQQNTVIDKVSEDAVTMPTQQNTDIINILEDAITIPTQQHTVITKDSEDVVTMPTGQHTAITKVSEDAVTMPTQQNTVISKVTDEAVTMPTQQNTAITKVSEDAVTMPMQQNTDIKVSEDVVVMPTQQNTAITKVSEEAVGTKVSETTDE